MKINVLDYYDQQLTLKFIEGFHTGHRNTLNNIIMAHESGQTLKSIYKQIKERAKHENINK